MAESEDGANNASLEGDTGEPEAASNGYRVQSTSEAEQDSLPFEFDTSSDTGATACYKFLRGSDSNSDSESDVMRANHTVRTRRYRRRNRVSTSSSSSSQDAASNHDEDSSRKSEEEEDEDDEELVAENTRVPQAKWHPVTATRRREIGVSNTVPAATVFARSTYSSLNLVQRLKLQYKMQHHDGCVNALHFNKSGTLLASGSDDLSVVLWRWNLNRPYLTYESGHRSNVFQAKFMPFCGDTHIVSCGRDGTVRLAELSCTGVCKGTRKLAQHKGSAHKLAIQPDSSHLLYSCGEDAVTYEIDLRQEKPCRCSTTKVNNTRVPLYSIQANPFRSTEYMVGGRDQFIRIYDKRMLDENEGNPVKKFCPLHLVTSEYKANVTCAVYNYNGTEVLGSYNDDDIYLFDNNHSDGATHIKEYKGHRNNATVKGVNFYGPHSEYVVSGSDCGNVFLWDKDTEQVVQWFEADEGGVVNVLEPHPIFPILATSGLDHDVKIWAPTSPTPASMDGLAQTMKRNRKDRTHERTHVEPDMDSQILWMLMQQMRRAARAQADGSALPSSSSSNSDDDDDLNSGDESNVPVSCMQS